MNHVRHSNIFTIPPYLSVGLIGAGGLGAMTALVLVKMGVQQLEIFDGDVVSDANIATQLHRVSDIGERKVDGLAHTLHTFSDELLLRPRHEFVTEDTDLSGHQLVIAAVDSIQARKDIWIAVTRAPQVEWFCDMRMAAEEFQLFLVDMHDLGAVEKYHAALFSLDDSMFPEVSCTMKATFYTASTAAGHAGKVLRDIVRREAYSHRLVHYIAPNDLFHQKIRIFNL